MAAANFHQIAPGEFRTFASACDLIRRTARSVTPARAGGAADGGPDRKPLNSKRCKRLEKTKMSAKSIPALVIALLLGTTALASAQTLVLPSYGYTYGYAYVPAYPPAGPYVAPQYAITPQYYAPGYSGYYGYAPAYGGWNGTRWNW
jgi:hypothetical protein